MKQYDIIIIGGGPGGYHAARLASERGKKTLLIEKESLGGTCLNWGCIPTKTLLNLAKQWSYSKELKDMGIESDPVYKHGKAMDWKNSVITILRNGVQSMLKKGKVDIVQGEAVIDNLSSSEKLIRVIIPDKKDEIYSSEYLIVATGVESVIPPIKGIESANVLTSKEILNIDKIPQRLVIIGGGVIGIEIAAVFSQLGSKVSVVEALPEILPNVDIDSIKILKNILGKKHDIEFYCGATVDLIEQFQLSMTQADKTFTLAFDDILVSTGRKANLSTYESVGIHVSREGIVVDDYMHTNIPKLYAIGDISGKYQLAHVAYRMAEVAISSILNKSSRMRYNAVPSIIYTNPETACCGLTEDQAKSQGIHVISASLPTVVSGRVVAEHGAASLGHCKIIAEKDSGRILGIHLVAPMASEIIAIATVILETEMRVKELVEIIFPHPTVGEIIHNVSLELYKKLN